MVNLGGKITRDDGQDNIAQFNYLNQKLHVTKSTKIIILRIYRIVRHPRDPKRGDHGYLTTFRDINTPKSGPFKYENNAQTLPKQFQNNFEKGQKMTFLALEMAKITISGGQILTKNLNFWGHL